MDWYNYSPWKEVSKTHNVFFGLWQLMAWMMGHPEWAHGTVQALMDP
jgi:hypothetical protein